MNYGGYPTYFPSYQSYAPNQYGMTQNTQQTTPQVTSGVRLVASKAEVVAAQIPFDGNEYYFKDTSTGKIYVKTFNFADGTAPIVTYSRDAEASISYATTEDINALRAEIEEIRKGQIKNDAER